MKQQLAKLWQSRSPRERKSFTVLAAILAVFLYAWLLQAAGPARSQLRASVAVLRGQAAALEQQAAEVSHLRAAPAAMVPSGSLRALVQARIVDAGFSAALVRIEAPDASRVQVVLGAVSYAGWLAWIASLEAQRVRLDTCRIEAMSTPGLVNVTATLMRTGF